MRTFTKRAVLTPLLLAAGIVTVWALAAFVFVGAWEQFLGMIIAAQHQLQQDLTAATRGASPRS